MKTYEFTLTVKSEFQPTTDTSGPIADDLARSLLPNVKITRLRIANIDEPVGEVIPADQCDCAGMQLEPIWTTDRTLRR